MAMRNPSLLVAFLFPCVIVLLQTEVTQAASSASRTVQVSGNGLSSFGSAAGFNTRQASDSFTNASLTRSAEAISRSDIGYVAGYVRASIVSNGGPASGSASANAGTNYLIDDLILSKLPGYSEQPDSVDVTAQITFDSDSDFSNLTITGNVASGPQFGAVPPTSGSPMVTSFAHITVDQPFALSFSVQLSKNIDTEFGTITGSFAASLDTIETFVVPEGYVVNSVDANVVDNVYLGSVHPVVGGVAGDYNFDGFVDAADYTVWRDAFETGIALPNDTTPDAVTTDDYDVWVAHYGSQQPCSTEGSLVPEPTSLLMLGMCGSLVVLLRR